MTLALQTKCYASDKLRKEGVWINTAASKNDRANEGARNDNTTD